MVKKLAAGMCALLLVGASPTALAQEAKTEPRSSKEAVELDAVEVTGRRIRSYSADDALTGTRMPTLLKDLPLSVGVVSQELIEDRGISQLSEALDNVSGAQRKLGYGGTQNFGAFIRGFDQGFLTLRGEPGWHHEHHHQAAPRSVPRSRTRRDRQLRSLSYRGRRGWADR